MDKHWLLGTRSILQYHDLQYHDDDLAKTKENFHSTFNNENKSTWNGPFAGGLTMCVKTPGRMRLIILATW